jgi:bifunctional non-homologous end joining protein LigD
MLARFGSIPTQGEWAYEVKWDGLRALLSTEGRFRIRSRRGWDMTDLVPELSALPVAVTVDGELVAFGADGSPDFPLICERIIMRRTNIRVTYMIFDLLSVDGRDLTLSPYSERRAALEALDLNGVYRQTPETFDDGEALFEAVCAHELEGIVAKRRTSLYRAGERGWLKIKNRDYSLRVEGESAMNGKRPKQFVWAN